MSNVISGNGNSDVIVVLIITVLLPSSAAAHHQSESPASVGLGDDEKRAASRVREIGRAHV